MPATRPTLDARIPAIHAIRGTFKFDDASGKVIGALPKGAMISGCKVNVKTPFNAGTTNPVTIGYDGAAAGIMAAATVAADAAGSKAGILFPVLDDDQDIFVTYSPTGAAPTAGELEVLVEFYVFPT